MKKTAAITELRRIMARLRAPNGCPWDREQTHRTIACHAIEEVYELLDAIEAGDDQEMIEELGDLLLQVVFHCQLARERRAFDFDQVADHLAQKLIRRHPHVFGKSKLKTAAAVWAQWDRIKKAEKQGTKHERTSALDGVPRHLPALMRAEKLLHKARKAGLAAPSVTWATNAGLTKAAWRARLFALVDYAQQRGWSAEALLRSELKKQEGAWRRQEKKGHRTGWFHGGMGHRKTTPGERD
jgi:XTP/dITP diphosphohydrolase